MTGFTQVKVYNLLFVWFHVRLKGTKDTKDVIKNCATLIFDKLFLA